MTKLECVGHYQKGVGTRLRKLKKKRGLGGRGNLTDAIIDQLQNFFFNSDKVNSTDTFNPVPGLPLEALYKIRPVFEDLTKDDELRKCLHGKTQNANESFNRKI